MDKGEKRGAPAPHGHVWRMSTDYRAVHNTGISMGFMGPIGIPWDGNH